MQAFIDSLAELIQRGGSVMIPLLALSLISLTLILERCWFWMRLRGAGSAGRLALLNDSLRRGDSKKSLGMVATDRSPYGQVVTRLLDAGPSDAVAMEVIEAQRPKFDRFMITLSTIITAAPLLGILGTVIGIIRSFNLLGAQETLTDPRAVSVGIAEALLTTALGLVIALFTLFPYMIFRGQVDRALGRLESVIAAAQQGGSQSDSVHRRDGEQESSSPKRVMSAASS